jgi:hypothetical protein
VRWNWLAGATAVTDGSRGLQSTDQQSRDSGVAERRMIPIVVGKSGVAPRRGWITHPIFRGLTSTATIAASLTR